MKYKARLALAGFLLAAMLCAPSALAAEKPIELNMTTPYMDKHPAVAGGLMPWFEQVDKESKGRLKISYFNPGTICPDGEIASALGVGSIDLGAHSVVRNAGAFPAISVVALQLISPGGLAGAELSWAFYKSQPTVQAEFKAFRPLAFWAGGAENIHTTKKPVRTLEDLKGLKIIAWSQTGMDTVRALGAIPIQQAPPDSYMALQRGMADGVICPIAPMRSFKLNEVIKFSTIARLYAAPFFCGISWDAWKKLPADLQAIIDATTGDKLVKQVGMAVDAGEAADLTTMKAEGLEVIILTPEEQARWFQAVQPLHEKWVKDSEGRGLSNAAKLYNDVVELRKQYVK